MQTSLSKLVTRSILWCVVPLVLAAVYVSADRVFDINSASQKRAAQVATNLRVSLDNNLRSRIASLKLLAESADAAPSTRRGCTSRHRSFTTISAARSY